MSQHIFPPLTPEEARRFIIVEPRSLYAEMIAQAATILCPNRSALFARNAEHALDILRKKKARCVAMSLLLPDLDGLDLLAIIRTERLATKVLVILDRHDQHTSDVLQSAGADLSIDPTNTGVDALHKALRNLILDQGIAAKCDAVAKPKMKVLSPTERLVLAIMGSGLDERQSAECLRMSKHTLHSHLKRIKLKIGIRTQTEVMREAIRMGYVRITQDRVLFPGQELALRERQASDPTISRFPRTPQLGYPL